jgi:hypothetical protein
MTKEDQKFIAQCRKAIKGLNNMTIKHPETAVLFNKTTDMLERKIKETEDKYSPDDTSINTNKI